ncbi:hypothetical protein OQA88_2030 [Cercophora sp. LCS_1]
MDTLFEGEMSRDNRRTGRHLCDPISGRIYGRGLGGSRRLDDASFSDPRKYFLTVLNAWMAEVLEEYAFITRKCEDALGQGFIDPGSQSESSGGIQDFEMWNDNMLQYLISRLSQTSKAWEDFEKIDLGYFTLESRSRYVPNIKKAVLKLEGCRERLQLLRNLVNANSKTVDQQEDGT